MGMGVKLGESRHEVGIGLVWRRLRSLDRELIDRELFGKYVISSRTQPWTIWFIKNEVPRLISS